MVSIVDFDDEVVHRSIQEPMAESPVAAASCRVQSKSLGTSSPWLSQPNELYASLGDDFGDLSRPAFGEKSSPRFGADGFGGSYEEWTNNTVGMTLGLADGDGEDHGAHEEEDSLISRRRVGGWSEIRARLQHVTLERVFADYYEKATSFFSWAPVYLVFETLSQCLMDIGCEVRVNFEEMCLEGQQTENVALIPFRVNVFLASENDMGHQTTRASSHEHGHALVTIADASAGRSGVHLVEFQRRSGDSFEFTRFFHSVLTRVRRVDTVADFVAGFPRGVASPFADEASPIPSMAVPPVVALPLPPPGPYDAYAYPGLPSASASASPLPHPHAYSRGTSAARSDLAPPPLASSSSSSAPSGLVTEFPVFRSISSDYFGSDLSTHVSGTGVCDPIPAAKTTRNDDDDNEVVPPPPGSVDCHAVMMCASLLEMILVGCASEFICSQLESARLLARLSKSPGNQSTMGAHERSLPVLVRLAASKHEGVARCGLVALRAYLSLDSNLNALVENTNTAALADSDSNATSGLRTSMSDPAVRLTSRGSTASTSDAASEQSEQSAKRDDQRTQLLQKLVSVVGAHLDGSGALSSSSDSMQMLAAQILNSIASAAPRAVHTPSHMRWLRAHDNGSSKRPSSSSSSSRFLPLVRSTLRKLDRIR